MRRSLISFARAFRFCTRKVPPGEEKELYKMEKKDYQKGIEFENVKPDNPGAKPDKNHKDIAQESVDKKKSEENKEKK